jgi:hypothetical protein
LILDAQDLAQFLDRNPELCEILVKVSQERQAGHGGHPVWMLTLVDYTDPVG